MYLHAPEEEAPWETGAASRWWLHHSLAALDSQLRGAGSRLILLRGPSRDALLKLARAAGASTLFWSRRYEPAVALRDEQVAEALRSNGVEARSFPGALLTEPGSVRNQSGKPFQVFTAFWRSCLLRLAPADPLPAPRRIPAPAKWPKSEPLDALELLPRVDWAAGLRTAWRPGSTRILLHLQHFFGHAWHDYPTQRDRPDLIATSRLSPHLHFGEITPAQIWHAIRCQAQTEGMPEKRWRESQFLTELGWREFAHHLLHHFPQSPAEPLRPEFKRFPWRRNPSGLAAWRKGRTGYPLVDAGMRELWTTGWMHNRVRMITASFLVKDLLVPWQEGARWFWDTLVDADLAQNTLGWQWTAGCGADATPYFRVFNPVLQGEKFDPHGNYVRRWCPELARLPDRWIQRPWQAPPEVRLGAGVVLGRNYPEPIVAHSVAREIALEAFEKIRRPDRRRDAGD